MTPRVALALTTCDRPAYTSTTLMTLLRHNDLSRFVLLQGDDASQDTRNVDMAREVGFELVHAPSERQGHMASIRALVAAAQERECDYTLVLEADYESVSGLPLEALDSSCWDSLRLYGKRKMREGPRALAATHRMGTNSPIEWRPAFPGYEFAPAAHWTPNSITKTALLAKYTHLPRVKDVCLQWHPPTLRAVDNVVWHLAEDTTPGFMP
jgi:hypothetical protein